MPLYEYQCDACGHRFEKIQKFSDALETTCPTCGGVVHKLMSSPAIQFKGSGFYITDYAKKDYLSASKADGKTEDAKSDGGKAEKTESSDKSEKAVTPEKSPKTTTDASSSSASTSTPTKSGT